MLDDADMNINVDMDVDVNVDLNVKRREGLRDGLMSERRNGYDSGRRRVMLAGVVGVDLSVVSQVLR